MDVDVIIVGAGVVGLACARESAKRGFSTLVIERHDSFGQETSSHNSEVIHSGIYYAPGSLKARLCPAANRRMYTECERMGVWHRRCGKLIVAVAPEEEPELQKLYDRGVVNGIEGMSLMTRDAAAKLEPEIRCHAAILLPSTGIVDSHELMKAYLREAREGGADVAYGIAVEAGESKQDGFVVNVREINGALQKITTRFVINAAGVGASDVAAGFGVRIDAAGYAFHPNRGHYYKVSPSKSRMVSRLVYPVPTPTEIGLGIHITVDRAGQAKLGPDAEYCEKLNAEEWYEFDDSPARREKFYTAALRYFPILERSDLSPDQVGVRSKVQAPGAPPRDFIIADESQKGLRGLVNLIGIESPGLTCSAEIAGEAVNIISGLL